MLTVAQCRKILGHTGCDMSDSAIESLRDQLYGLADVSIDRFLDVRRKNGSKIVLNAQIKPLEGLTDIERGEWEERAAITEFEAGLPRSEAERNASNHLREGKRKYP